MHGTGTHTINFGRASQHAGVLDTTVHARFVLAHECDVVVCRQAALGKENKGGAKWNDICPKYVKPDAVHIDRHVLKQIKEGRYLEFNLNFDRNIELSFAAERLADIRKNLMKEEWGWDHAEDLQDYCRGTLLLMGAGGTETQLHVDWTEACNIAFSWEVSSSVHVHVCCMVSRVAPSQQRLLEIYIVQSAVLVAPSMMISKLQTCTNRHSSERQGMECQTMLNCTTCCVCLQKGDTDVLALWHFFDPVIVEPTSAWVQELQRLPANRRQPGDPPADKSGAQGLLDGITLTPNRLAELREHLERLGVLYNDKYRARMHVVEQRHGQMVHVPAGYMHQVSNMKACTKMAFDIYNRANLARYAMSWQYVTSQIYRSPDYMGAGVVVK